MRYFGSKGSVIEAVRRLVTAAVPKGTFCDPFGGIAVVGRAFKSLGYHVSSGDVLLFAHMFQVATITRSRALPFRNVVAALGLHSAYKIPTFLTAGADRQGWLVEEYASTRKFFTIANAHRIQCCWRHITEWHEGGLTSPKEHAVLMASLINSMDKVANTAGTYYAYLKTFSRKALNPFSYELLPPTRGPIGLAAHCDAKTLVERAHYDVLYLDPPYNERDYAGYYHLPETIATGKIVEVRGLCGRNTAPSSKSRFTKAAEVQAAVADLLLAARFRLLVFHYSDDGLLTPSELKKLLRSLGPVQKYPLQALGYRTTPGKRSTGHVLYLVRHG